MIFFLFSVSSFFSGGLKIVRAFQFTLPPLSFHLLEPFSALHKGVPEIVQECLGKATFYS